MCAVSLLVVEMHLTLSALPASVSLSSSVSFGNLTLYYFDSNRIHTGSTYTGHFENVKEFSDSLDEYERKTGNHIPIHVDAAR